MTEQEIEELMVACRGHPAPTQLYFKIPKGVSLMTISRANIPAQVSRPPMKKKMAQGKPKNVGKMAEFRKMVEEGKVEGMVIVATSKDGETLATVAGLISPTQMTGLLETVKLQLLLG
ncbi:hypothetical protein EBT31_08835 [bacterium]|nr:hypothetical protein [bacterium]